MPADAVAALERNDPVAALERLIALWGEKKSPDLAQRIQQLGKILGGALPALDDGSPNEEGDWLVLASRGRAVDMERLLASFDDGISRVIADRLDRLRDRPPDPRATPAILAFAESLPFSSGPARRVWTAWFQYARHLADPGLKPGILRMIEAAEARLNTADPPRFLEFEHFLLNRLRPLLETLPVPADCGPIESLDRAIAKLQRQGAPPKARLLAEVESPIRAHFSRVLEDPDDLGAIQVWADALSEAADPRGEFIALQLIREHRPLTHDERAQEKRLQKRHRNRWLGALDAVVDSHSARFRRGLLDAAHVMVKSEAQRSLLDRPEWRTVRILQTSTAHLLSGVPANVERIGMRLLPGDDGEVRGPPGFVLTDIKPPSWTQFTELARSKEPYTFRALCTALPGTPTATHVRGLLDLAGLPNLEELHLVDNAHWYRRNPAEAGIARLGALAQGDILSRIDRLVLDRITPVAQAPDALWWQTYRPKELILTGSGPWIRSYRFADDGVHATISKPGPATFVPSGSSAGLSTLKRTLASYLGPANQYASITVRSRSLPARELDTFTDALALCAEVVLPKLKRERKTDP